MWLICLFRTVAVAAQETWPRPSVSPQPTVVASTQCCVLTSLLGLLRRWGGLCDDGRNAGRPRPVLRRDHREERQEVQTILRHELRHGNEEVRWWSR